MSSTPVTATSVFPAFVRLALTIFEPLAALNGAYLALWDAPALIQVFTRTLDGAVPEPPADSAYLFSSIAAGWLLHAALGGVVLRVADDARLWRAVCAAMLLSDAVVVHATLQGVGGLERWARLDEWSMREAAANAVTFGMLAIRLWVVGTGGMGKMKAQ